MWLHGMIDGYSFSIKLYEYGSKWGIQQGCISKLEIRKNGCIVANYDRGWDIEPKDDEARAVLAEILRRYNG
ncbi:DUF7678 domain-containing protein [uncultured Flavonifractor sp.]|uniref:DUF7678 domain-containing protein n=1 Tax=Flavonifractor sp. An4 TaxID=1965634 RepID=UPI000B3742ED|nr:hypothetical protein [Flavonifractor sp. An4]OUO07775.1 hypothetical protein B5F94_15680 [Flavonifractor sp. An4]